jgi:hypothetical protein
MIYKLCLRGEIIVERTTTGFMKIWALVFGVDFLFHLISFTYIAWVGSICHVDTFLRYRVFVREGRGGCAVCIAKDKIGGSGGWEESGGSREHSEFVLCSLGGCLCAQNTVCTFCTHWVVHRAGRGYTMLQQLYNTQCVQKVHTVFCAQRHPPSEHSTNSECSLEPHWTLLILPTLDFVFCNTHAHHPVPSVKNSVSQECIHVTNWTHPCEIRKTDQMEQKISTLKTSAQILTKPVVVLQLLFPS